VPALQLARSRHEASVEDAYVQEGPFQEEQGDGVELLAVPVSVG
jgi:hypothetical protein